MTRSPVPMPCGPGCMPTAATLDTLSPWMPFAPGASTASWRHSTPPTPASSSSRLAVPLVSVPPSWDASIAVAAGPIAPWDGYVWRCHRRRYAGLDWSGSLVASACYHRAPDLFLIGWIWPALYFGLSYGVCLGGVITQRRSPLVHRRLRPACGPHDDLLALMQPSMCVVALRCAAMLTSSGGRSHRSLAWRSPPQRGRRTTGRPTSRQGLRRSRAISRRPR